MSETDIKVEAMPEAEITVGETSRQGGCQRNHPQLVTIVHVPHHIRRGRQYDYEPNFVSIGPYFHGRQNLSDTENRKAQFALDLHKNLPIEETNIIDTLIAKFRPLEARTRACYPNSISLGSDEFLKMLALDCCFIIQVIISTFHRVTKSRALLGFNIEKVRSDMLLLENQIPLFLIQEAYNCVSNRRNPRLPPFHRILKPFLFYDMPWQFNEDGMSIDDEGIKADHLLDLYWRCSLPPKHKLELSERFISEGTSAKRPSLAEVHLPSDTNDKLIHNATFLHQTAGVTFKKRKYAKGFGVTFKKGVLNMPCLKIDSSQTTLLLNLIAFEYFQAARNQIYMSFMLLMDALIDTEGDVALLEEKGVIRNNLRSNEQAATFFNDIGNFCSATCKFNLFGSMCKEVNDFYASSSDRQLASLRHNYCSSLWAVISLVAGSVLLLMTFLQTFYTVYGYYHPR